MRLIDADELRKEKLDLIDREKLVQEIKSQSNRLCLGHISTSDIDVEDIVQLIVDAPTVDAEPVRHGKWELNEDGKWACSYCEGLAVKHPDEPEKWQALTTYCPNCGAKMDLEGDNG